MRLVPLLAGVLLLGVGLIQNGLSTSSRWTAAGLLVFCLSASTYFASWPLSRDERGGRRFQVDFLWFLIYLGVGAVGALWLYLLLRL